MGVDLHARFGIRTSAWRNHRFLYRINKEAAKANEVIGNGITKRPEAVGKWKYVVADTLAEALTGQ